MKILVVDDEQDMETLFQQRFRKEIKNKTYDFSFANSGQQALTYLQQHANESTLILSDINMPGMSGFDLLKQIKQNYTPPPTVMMITAYGDSDNYNKALTLGASDFLTKPIDFAQLKEKLTVLN
jgi:CheY-like chemotaxis protein